MSGGDRKEGRPSPPDERHTRAVLEILLALLSINAVRIDAGLMPVHWDNELASYAHSHAVVMDSADSLFHSSDLSSLLPGRLWVGENVGICHGCNEVPVQAYLDSPTHRDVILSPRATHFGTANVDGHDVQIFAQDEDAITLPRYAVLYEGEP